MLLSVTHSGGLGKALLLGFRTVPLSSISIILTQLQIAQIIRLVMPYATLKWFVENRRNGKRKRRQREKFGRQLQIISVEVEA